MLSIYFKCNEAQLKGHAIWSTLTTIIGFIIPFEVKSDSESYTKAVATVLTKMVLHRLGNKERGSNSTETYI